MYTSKQNSSTSSHARRNPSSMSYEAIFKGSAIRPANLKPSRAHCPIKQDGDAYFKDVFAGPVL